MIVGKWCIVAYANELATVDRMASLWNFLAELLLTFQEEQPFRPP